MLKKFKKSDFKAGDIVLQKDKNRYRIMLILGFLEHRGYDPYLEVKVLYSNGFSTETRQIVPNGIMQLKHKLIVISKTKLVKVLYG
jgi:uncharacterized protein (UPF0371 family)